MPQFEFRQRFHLLDEDRVKSDLSILPLPDPFENVRLVSGKKGAAIGDSPRLFLDAGRAHFGAKLGGPVRDQVHGLDVYEWLPGQIFVSTEATGALGINATITVEQIAKWFVASPGLTAKQTLAAELYCAAGFDAPFRSRFITLMTSLESLMDHLPRPDDVRLLVSSLEAQVRSATIAADQRQSLLGSLAWLHDESIGQAGRRIAASVLGEYGGLSPSKFFTRCYELRSMIVHSGAVPSDVDLLDVANDLHRFVGDVLHTSIGIPSA